ncbi:fumarate reductase/succinate dehydrogenase flavoprotein-like protein [Leptolyngbya boryana NIES-2135]|uniref:Fumarate reductase/succinate dehydrogenase flavoprotein-like protein n=1 Tax=Leptolyngbya boryana NIES-2135 TaxID=1973484 RepID=A0A1Z4JLQ3_LEPBY|nr:NAD(P)/FAD-dependent oxidoreductase [Leptolyngbya boryana]MBD2367515.1 NAD(P)/FAD-dependent oxidoreductase [Leptolyngbya sp. FACHB-161]MBD2374039.1 NAD(P)/FAD-dependent oxidoreductase [Leptolyngbya sp. FACHB-238]MBD2398664.1 NAD(P)/FAD-dependent oxidoreductase [Leptolyngbya sp. FACHB-239]MBD2404888.1 NAD(P)/FAD-dependent oxidoreductase [Leptolyngbya sp. FACHB-402]BAY57558.1 fumarate reductase/succinate dehydrogenase flavoprotein-like protein [Leptolyngbya boryana NIES-2135]
MKVVVIGGGAAGFFGAICAAQAGAEVTLLEAGQNCLSKVLISGGGRCNVTHSCFEPALLVQHYPRGGKALRGAFSQFQPKHTIEWFTDRNVKLKTEADGRIFPITDDARTIADCLLNQAADLGVKIYTQSPVKAVAKVEDQFLVTLRSEQVLTADRVLIATGSNPNGYQFARSLGHSVIDPVPSLFTFNIRDDRLTDLAGVSVDPVRLRLQVGEAKFEQTGALLITHWGVSGPAVLKLSAWAARELHDARYQARLSINWLPKQNPEQLRQELTAVRNQIPQKTIAANCPVMLPRRLWERLTEAVGIQKERRWAELSNKTLNQLIQELMQGSYQISGKGVFKDEFVTCGGVNLKEINFKTMESRCCPGLYFAGEVLDIDGVTGGFNFQSAWTTGWIAGNAIAKVSASVHRPQ